MNFFIASSEDIIEKDEHHLMFINWENYRGISSRPVRSVHTFANDKESIELSLYFQVKHLSNGHRFNSFLRLGSFVVKCAQCLKNVKCGYSLYFGCNVLNGWSRLKFCNDSLMLIQLWNSSLVPLSRIVISLHIEWTTILRKGNPHSHIHRSANVTQMLG